MDRLSFDIFEPDKEKFRLTPNLIVFCLWLLVITFLWLLPAHSPVRVWILSIVGLISFYYMITAFLKYESLDGVIKGKLIFESGVIIINDDTYKLEDISNIDFGFIDFYGQRNSLRSFNPALSQGVDNFITFAYKSKQPIKVYFRIQGRHGSQDLYPFINEAVQCGAMTYYRAIDLIDVENVRKPGTN